MSRNLGYRDLSYEAQKAKQKILACQRSSNPMVRAVGDGDPQSLESFAAAAVSPLANEDAKAWSEALAAAASLGRLECLKVAACLGNPDAQDNSGRTALTHAVCEGAVDCVEFLAPKTTPGIRDNSGRTAWMHAAANGQMRMMDLLCAEFAPFDTASSGEDALMLAADNGWAEMVKRLLPHSDANAHRDSLGRNALMQALSRDYWRCAELLIPVSDMAAQDNDGLTALMMAAQFSGEQAVKAILPLSDPLTIDWNGRNALMVAASAGKMKNMELLLRHGPDARTHDPRSSKRGHAYMGGLTAFMIAACKGHHECVKALLPVSDPLAQDDSGHAALSLAAANGSIECIPTLLTKEAARVKNNAGQAAVAVAAKLEEWECAIAIARKSSSEDVRLACDWARKAADENGEALAKAAVGQLTAIAESLELAETVTMGAGDMNSGTAAARRAPRSL